MRSGSIAASSSARSTSRACKAIADLDRARDRRSSRRWSCSTIYFGVCPARSSTPSPRSTRSCSSRAIEAALAADEDRRARRELRSAMNLTFAVPALRPCAAGAHPRGRRDGAAARRRHPRRALDAARQRGWRSALLGARASSLSVAAAPSARRRPSTAPSSSTRFARFMKVADADRLGRRASLMSADFMRRDGHRPLRVPGPDRARRRSAC